MLNVKPQDVDWTIECLPEIDGPEGHFATGDDDYDRAIVADINEQLDNGNEWAWCVVKLTGAIDGLVASAYLGGCSYGSREAFETDAYYKDMQHEVCEELLTQLTAIMTRYGG